MDVLFGILWSTGATTLEDLMDLDIRDLAEVHNYIVSLPSETQRSPSQECAHASGCLRRKSVKGKTFLCKFFGNRRRNRG